MVVIKEHKIEKGVKPAPEMLPKKESIETRVEAPKISTIKPKAPKKAIKVSTARLVKKHVSSIKELERQKQVKILADLALEKGVHHAVAIAKKIDNAYVLDEFHDALIDELHEE